MPVLSAKTYDIGDRVRLSIEITDLESTGEPPIDPDELVFTMKEPDGSITTWVYGTDPEVVRDGVGLFHVHWDTAQAGKHWSRFVASGNVGAAEELAFGVRTSRVL